MGRNVNRWYKSPKNTYFGGGFRVFPPLKSSKKEDIYEWLLLLDEVNWFMTYWIEKPIDDFLVREAIQVAWCNIGSVPQETYDNLYSQGDIAVSSYITYIISTSYYSTFRREKKYWVRNEIKSYEWWREYEDTH